MGENWILSQAMAQPNTFWGVAAPTIGDVERTCFLGESGILSVAEPGDIPPNAYNINKNRITLGEWQCNPGLFRGLGGAGTRFEPFRVLVR